MQGYERLESAIGHSFARRTLLEVALTHRSYLNEHTGSGRDHNERLEFLGDAVLELAVSALLMARFPAYTEGELTVTRAALVSEGSLAEIGGALALGDWLFLGRGEESSGGRRKPSLVANALEAVIGAVFLDAGYASAEALVVRLLTGAIEAAAERRADWKTRVQERVQAERRETPRYVVVAESGPDHDKRFRVALTLGGEPFAEGEGRTKKEAEQAAAQLAMTRLGLAEAGKAEP